MTPPVARTCQSLNQERLSNCKALGYKLYHWNNLEFENYSLGETEEECRYRILNTGMDAAFGKDGIYAGRKMEGPEHLKDRYVTEDVPYGMVLLSTLGGPSWSSDPYSRLCDSIGLRHQSDRLLLEDR